MKLHGGYIGVESEGEGKGSSFYIDIPISRKETTDDDVVEAVRTFASTIHHSNTNSSDASHSTKSVAVSLRGSTGASSRSSVSSRGSLIRKKVRVGIQPVPEFYSEQNDVYAKYYSKKILIVDDSSTNRKLVNRLLADKIGLRDEAIDGIDAVAKCKHSIDSGNAYDIVMMDYSMPNMDGPTATREIRSLGFRGVIVGVTGMSHDSDVQTFINAGADRVMIKPLDAEEFWDAVCGRLI